MFYSLRTIVVVALLGAMSSPVLGQENTPLQDLAQEISNIFNSKKNNNPGYYLKWYFVKVKSFPGCGENRSYQKSTANFEKAKDFSSAVDILYVTDRVVAEAHVHVIAYLQRISNGRIVSRNLWQVRYRYNPDISAWEFVSVDQYVQCMTNKNDSFYTYSCPNGGLNLFSWTKMIGLVLKGDVAFHLLGK
ncbi:MAG: hypothetical protein PHE24_02355 [Patescibacteria group bacterium]|nr:hypothetical protein [Patescibacteria group bacterium]